MLGPNVGLSVENVTKTTMKGKKTRSSSFFAIAIYFTPIEIKMQKKLYMKWRS
jgi:hypothetical protein